MTKYSTTSRFGKSYEQIIEVYEALLNGKTPAIAFYNNDQDKLDEYYNKFYAITNAKIELVLMSDKLYSIKLVTPPLGK